MSCELFKKIGEGGAKLVYAANPTGFFSSLANSASSVVYCVAKNIFRVGDLEKEVATSMAIRNRARVLGVSTKHLAVDYEHTDVIINGKKAISCPKAASNLEKEAERGSLSWNQRLDYCHQMVSAVASLHKIGYVHRDLKLDNFLTFKGWFGGVTAKLNDYGTAVSQDVNEVCLSSKGNARSASPEGTMSHKAEVYAMGLTCINMLEEMCLQASGKEMIIDPPPALINLPRKKKRGINEYIMRHKDVSISGTAARDWIRRFLSRIWFALTGRHIIDTKHEKTIYTYIDALVRELKIREVSSSWQAERLGHLFKEMMAADPTKRITMAEAQARLNEELSSTPVWATRKVMALLGQALSAITN